MTSAIPAFIKESVNEAGARLGRALDKLEWPSGGKNAPPSELNALINFQCCLSRLDADFDFYSEGTIAERGRIDLLGSNGKASLAMEAKRLANLNQSAVSALNDLRRLRCDEFAPAYCPPTPNREVTRWWEKSDSRWGVLLITSFHGDAVREAWEAQDTETAARYMRVAGFRKFEGFMSLHRAEDLQRFSAPIPLPSRWCETADKGWILCGILDLT